MKSFIFILGALLTFGLAADVHGAMQYNWSRNEGWFTFDGPTEVSFSAELQNPERHFPGAAVADYGWYGLDRFNNATGAYGSFKNGETAAFTARDRIGLWVRDTAGNTFGSARNGLTGLFTFAGKGNSATGEYTLYAADIFRGNYRIYLFSKETPVTTGQPLPGVLTTLLAGGGVLYGLRKKT